MSHNIELLLNPSLYPVYVTSTNMIVPFTFTTMNAKELYMKIIQLGTKLYNLVINLIRPIVFLFKDVLISGTKMLSIFYSHTIKDITATEAVYSFLLILFVAFIVFVICIMAIHILDSEKIYRESERKNHQLKEKLKYVEKQLEQMNQLKQTQANDWELFSESHSNALKNLHLEMSKKIQKLEKKMERKMKKLNEEIDLYM